MAPSREREMMWKTFFSAVIARVIPKISVQNYRNSRNRGTYAKTIGPKFPKMAASREVNDVNKIF